MADLEKKLEVEEAELEQVRDSLKGMSISRATLINADKTDEFTVQIDAKQRELEPWTAKINDKQSLVDVATSEREALAKKATGMQTALEEARASLAALKEGDGSKQQESNDLKREAAKVQKELSVKEANVEVSPLSRCENVSRG